MENLKFKTNIKCSACVAKVTPVLNKIAGAEHWVVDLLNPDRLLSIYTEHEVDPTSIIAGLQTVGYKAEEVK